MSEIATTARIRELFTDGGFWDSDVFDEWLEQHDAEVAKATEERIIKLLEGQRCECLDIPLEDKIRIFQSDLEALNHVNCFYTSIDAVIALIKGENK